MAEKKDSINGRTVSARKQLKNTAIGKAFVITAIYIIFGCAWILLSDTLVDMMIPDRSNVLTFSIIKGLVYVALTAALICGLTYPAFKRILAAQEKLQKTNDDLELTNSALTRERNKLIASEMKLMETEKNLRENQRSTSVLLENIPGMVYRCMMDKEWTMTYASNGSTALTGYPPSSLIDNKEISFSDVIIPKYRQYLIDKWAQIVRQRTRFTDEYEIMTAAGERRWVWEQGQGVYDDDGNVVALEGLIIDITKRKQQEDRLVYLSEHNEMTGLLNRGKCEDIMSTVFEECGDNQKALLLVDMKKFNLLNLTHGYRFSELLIRDIASQLHRLIDSRTMLFHVAYSQFAFFVIDYENQAALVKLSNKITDSLHELLTENKLMCGIGIVEIDDFRIEPSSILKYASIAAEQEEPNQQSRWHIFNKTMEESVRRQDAIKNELADCAKNEKEKDRRLYLEYQPIISVTSGRIQCFEALARFKSDIYGLISPLEFIPIAEETQIIVPLGRKIMREAFRFLKELHSKGFEDTMIAVNISAVQLLRDDFLPDLTALIAETGVAPANISMEITESYFSDNYDEINEKLSRLKNLGISVAIDDFGIGYSSLARERELNVNCLKIDKYFIEKLSKHDQNETITADIISMAHKLGHCVIAEGVEEEKQKIYLLENNCDYMQGYLFSRPVPPEKALKLLPVKFL